MTFGILVKGPAGQTWMDSTLITWNMVEVFTVNAGDSITKTYDSLAGREFMAIQIPLEVPKVDSYTYEKTIVVAGNQVSVYGGNQIAEIVVLCR
ncbi:hypothetical protein [Polynucleobacter sp. UK-Kesae-W10]|uniref:hypothetical protein n=1 Tax=Polynucleobacter sp. UK-Kesae-W10 TaxID=1819738 RepID=UPI001C0AA317|nr:hypothetical protein [Polynucleobacter sp. UK-Kesae-W10]MBU3577597.1 hypothetical protein [Polynucleobacter sp. UK-Kesae-W10]